MRVFLKNFEILGYNRVDFVVRWDSKARNILVFWFQNCDKSYLNCEELPLNKQGRILYDKKFRYTRRKNDFKRIFFTSLSALNQIKINRKDEGLWLGAQKV